MNLQFQSEKDIEMFRNSAAVIPIFELLRSCISFHSGIEVRFRAQTIRKFAEYFKNKKG
jgi:hypothetical protein